MSLSIGILLVALLAVVFLQIMHRRAGAVALIVWCGIALVVGLREFETERDLRIFGLEAEPWNFGAFMLVMLAYNVNFLLKKPKAMDAEPLPPFAANSEEQDPLP